MEVEGKAEIFLHLLLPKGVEPIRVMVNNRPVRFKRVMVEQSPYVDVDFRLLNRAAVTVQ
jgi:hypothetical protein